MCCGVSGRLAAELGCEIQDFYFMIGFRDASVLGIRRIRHRVLYIDVMGEELEEDVFCEWKTNDDGVLEY